MGRRRKTDKHLPAKVYLEHGAYYFRATGQPRKSLGRDLGEALAVYGSLVGASWHGKTVGDAIDRYRAEILPLKRSKTTIADQGKQLERLRSAFGHLLPTSVSAQHCYKYADARRSKDGKPVPVAARHEVTLLAHVFSYAIRWGMASTNPARDLKVSKRATKRRQVTVEEVLALRALATDRIQVVIDLALSTGQRLSDILGFKREHITDAGLMISQGKTGARIAMEITPHLAAILARAKALPPQLGTGAEYLVRSRNGKPYAASGFKAIWQRLMTKATTPGANGEPAVLVERFTFHDLRSVSADGAATPEEARARLGHTTVATTKRFYLRGAEKAKPRE